MPRRRGSAASARRAPALPADDGARRLEEKCGANRMDVGGAWYL